MSIVLNQRTPQNELYCKIGENGEFLNRRTATWSPFVTKMIQKLENNIYESDLRHLINEM